MGFSNFTLRDVVRQFCLVTSEVPDLFADARDVEPSPLMRSILGEYTPLALAINTEKARSELLIAPILVEVRSHLSHRISLFSGVEFVADAAQGLTGYCDFLLARSAEQQFLTSPLLMVVEAKNENLKSGLGQCAATMVGARLFNQREGGPVDRLFGAVVQQGDELTPKCVWTRWAWRKLKSSLRQTTGEGC